ncbi:ADAMTS-like protein 5 [Paramormyrops kingsleyae]|uniref:ADAMTS like 5 n=1 Tax=Paramormyrops kingsleyae TaxID=1676925 RepID=A0A3B3T7B8_9TELE|nr:ADAMTS-like protein 5 [Paramormyrops kingsleyae]XP_023669968.1 ADAMTS-like protein 5 [Paramormyrops kingsleyae]XP_023669970.1 ADAMTS-like protein 5 [Paramormyrops kingsleyae]XP_023669971.1 ADAMTS-like protein 5 [Paramormyrops kingsleyae]
MPHNFTRRPPPRLALAVVALLLPPLCLTSPRSSWVSAGGALGQPVRTRRQLPYENDWGSWGGWSTCSRTCGGGASMRTRVCITRNLIAGPCPGDTRQYKICNTPECPAGSLEFRELQCAAFNDRPLVAGNSYKWTTFHGGSNPCELSCLALGQNFYYNFGRVLDGTSCDTEPGVVCVNGRCLRPGCDLILGSSQREDACMVCGGQNSTCLRHRSVYRSGQQGAGLFGYNEVAMIPAGATHIRVTDNSKNYLALQNGRSQFIINGDWKISIPGEYSIAGTKVLYRRSTDTWESFEAPGPTREDLHVMLLSTDTNPGIEYEYWLPRDSYTLYHGQRGPLRQPYHAATFPPVSMTTTVRPLPVTTRPFWGGWPAQRPQQQPLPRLERDESHRNLLPQGPQSGRCRRCRKVRGRGERQRQYCQKDFVFRAKVLGKLYLGEETRYDVHVIHTYRNRFRLERREFLWVPNTCDCPLMEEGRQYVLMARRHVNYERTLNRILLEEDSYVQQYRPREDSLLRPLEEICSNHGPRLPSTKS